MKFLIVLLFSLVSFVPSGACREDDPGRMTGFANSLYNEGEYYRAVTEYMRISSYFPAYRDSFLVRIADCYYKGDQFETAIQKYQRAYVRIQDSVEKDYCVFQLARCRFQLQETTESLELLSGLVSESAVWSNQAAYYMGYITAGQFKFNISSGWLGKVETAHPWYENAHALSKDVLQGNRLPQKKPLFAGFLSAVIPGAGYCYSGHPKIGVASLVLNSLFAYSAYEAFREDTYVMGSTITLIGLGWYFGNIYGSVNKTEQYNRNVRIQFVKSLDFRYFE